MDELLENHFPNAVGIIFSDTFSYKLKFFHRYGIPFLKEEHFSGDFPYKISLSCFSHKEQVGMVNRDAFNGV